MGAQPLPAATAVAALLFLILLSRPGSALQIIKQLSPCSADTDAGIVDLTPLGNTDGTARFTQLKSLLDPLAIFYDWNPCYDFSETAGQGEGVCQSVSLCITVDGLPQYDYGKQSSASFVVNGSQLLLQYSNKVIQSTATIVLSCSLGLDTATVTNDDTSSNLVIQLSSARACFSSFQKSGLSTGSILCIAFFSASALYLIGGMAYMKARHRVCGAQLIPNRSFWKEIPALVKEGFLCTTGTIGLTRKQGYEAA